MAADSQVLSTIPVYLALLMSMHGALLRTVLLGLQDHHQHKRSLAAGRWQLQILQWVRLEGCPWD